MSKTIKYWTTGTRQPNIRAEGPPADLLAWTAYFPHTPDIPPLAVCNDVFRKGFRDGGFNGDAHWEPFELTPAEYDEFVQTLLADPKAGYRTLESPPWVQTEIDWLAYVSWVRHGVPVEPYRALLYKYHALVDVVRVARASGRKVTWWLTTYRLMAVHKRMQRLLARHRKSSP